MQPNDSHVVRAGADPIRPADQPERSLRPVDGNAQMAWNAAWSASQQEPNPTVGGVPATEHAQTDFLAVNDAAGMADDFPALGTAVKSIGRAARSSRTSQAAATGKKQRGTSKSSQSKPAGVLDGSALPKGRESKPAVRLLDAPPKPTAKRAPKPEEASQPQAWEIEGQRINREQKARVDARRAEATQQKLAPEVDGASERQADGDAALESDAVEDDGAAQKRSRRRAGNRFQAKMVVKVSRLSLLLVCALLHFHCRCALTQSPVQNFAAGDETGASNGAGISADTRARAAAGDCAR